MILSRRLVYPLCLFAGSLPAITARAPPPDIFAPARAGFGAAGAGVPATRAVFLFDMLRPFALDAQRVGGFALGLATLLFGWGMLDGRVLPRWLGAAAVAAGGGIRPRTRDAAVRLGHA